MATEDTKDLTIEELLDRIEHSYNFESEGDPLQKCPEWIELRARLDGQE